jgi:hypothetical protein
MVYSRVLMKPDPKKDDRAERLAAALRENLKRRKEQARNQAQALADKEKKKPSTPQTTGEKRGG